MSFSKIVSREHRVDPYISFMFFYVLCFNTELEPKINMDYLNNLITDDVTQFVCDRHKYEITQSH